MPINANHQHNCSNGIFQQITNLTSKKLRLETDSDYANINSVGAVIEDLDKQIKEKVGDRPKVLSGKYLITVTTSVTPEHVEPEKVVPEKVVRRFKYQKIGD